MKAIKKILATLLCLCMIIGFASTATLAAGTETGSITLQSTADVSIKGRDFLVFKIFNATKSTAADGKEIVAYGWDEATKTEYEKIFFGNNSIIGMESGTIHDVADYLRTLDGDNSEFSKFATNLYNKIKANDVLMATAASHSATSNTLTIDDLELGYYLIYDSTTLGSDNKVRSAIMLTTPGENKVVTIKADLPTISKTVMGNDGVEQKGTSATIGDCVQFFIRCTMPDHSNYSEENGYTYIITDTLPEGLTFINEADHKFVVSINDTVLEENVGYKFEMNSEKEFVVTIIDAIKYAADSDILISYHAKVNEKAQNDNKNEATLTYSSDPTDKTMLGNSTSNASVYLYQLVLTKYAEHTDGSISATRLAGAKFELYKKGASEPIKFEKEEAQNAQGQTYYYYRVDPNGTVTELETINDETYGASNTIKGGGFADVMIFGLAEGDYELDEIKAPDGYVVPNYRFQISVKDDIGKTSGIITKLELTTTAVADGKTGGKIVNAGFKIDEFAIWASITNATGSALPETGGIGTTLFTILGIIMMAGAIAFFTSRKRSSVA